MMDLISVLMCVYKEPLEYIEEAVNSILQQTYPNIELVIIVDNPKSTYIIDYLHSAKEKDRRIKLYINDKNRGLVYSLNKGLKYCKGKYIARMDADDISAPQRLNQQMKFIQENNYDIVASNFLVFNSNLKKELKFPKESSDCCRMLKRKNCLPHPAWLVKKEVFFNLNGYRDIDFCEDYDFLIRAAVEGYKLGNVQSTLLNYRLSEDGISRKHVVEQNVIFKYLALAYRKKIIPSMDEYHEFVKSDKFNKWFESEYALEKKKENIKKSTSVVATICNIFIYICSPAYLAKKVYYKL